MSTELPLYLHNKYFSEPAESLLRPPLEFCENVNGKIEQLADLRDRYVACVKRVALACIFCAAAGAYYVNYFGSSFLKKRLSLAVLGCLGMSLAIRVKTAYSIYSKQYQTVKEDIEQYPERFLFRDKIVPKKSINQKILDFFPPGFKSYPTWIETKEWNIEGGEQAGRVFTNLEAKEIKDWTEVNEDQQSWLDLLDFVVEASEIPEFIKKELVREVLPLAIPSHFLSLLPPNSQLRYLEEGQVVFRRNYSEGEKAQAIIAYMKDSEICYLKADDLKDLLIKRYQISLIPPENSLDSSESK